MASISVLFMSLGSAFATLLAQTPIAGGAQSPEAVGQVVADQPVRVAFSSLVPRHLYGPVSYPPLARLARRQGTVRIDLIIDSKGNVTKATALDGPPMLRPAAEAICAAWAFEPMKHEGRARSVSCEVSIPFRLKDVAAVSDDSAAVPAVLEIEMAPVQVDIKLDREAIRDEVASKLRDFGISLVESHPPGTVGGLHLRLELQALRTYDGIYLQGVNARWSLFPGPEVAEPRPGQSVQALRGGHLVAQRGGSNHIEMMSRMIQRTLSEMLIPGLKGILVEHPHRAETAKETPPMENGEYRRAPDAPMPMVVTFDFSQVKIKRQPLAPPYPSTAKAKGIQGTVKMIITIDPAGTPIEVEAIEGPPELLAAALRYALNWEFYPCTLDGKPQYARFSLVMPFRLR
jgi:TonB family protein